MTTEEIEKEANYYASEIDNWRDIPWVRVRAAFIAGAKLNKTTKKHNYTKGQIDNICFEKNITYKS
jgi:hypothetical protein